MASEKPMDKTFTEIVALVKDHHLPCPSTIVQRYNFHTCNQKAGESISEYVAELRKLPEFCEFNNTLADMLRDRIVCGSKDKRLQNKLLAEKKLTHDQALTIAKALETTEKEAKNLQEGSSSVPVHAVYQERCQPAKRVTKQTINRPQKTVGPECYRCGGKHKASECKFRDAEYLLCKKKGHIARACRSKHKSQIRTHQLLTSTTDQAETDEYSLYHTQGHGTTPPFLVNFSMNGKDISMELDTGATLSLVSEKTYHSLFPQMQHHSQGLLKQNSKPTPEKF